MKCLDCPLKYIGQTRRTFNIRYKEHIHTIRKKNNCGYSNHKLNKGHTYGTVADTMDIIRMRRKGRYLNTLEKYHIYKISRNNLHMNDTSKRTILYFKHCMSSTIGTAHTILSRIYKQE
jgi:hypothetical protein